VIQPLESDGKPYSHWSGIQKEFHPNHLGASFLVFVGSGSSYISVSRKAAAPGSTLPVGGSLKRANAALPSLRGGWRFYHDDTVPS
jgi:hypothetical protein